MRLAVVVDPRLGADESARVRERVAAVPRVAITGTHTREDLVAAAARRASGWVPREPSRVPAIWMLTVDGNAAAIDGAARALAAIPGVERVRSDPAWIERSGEWRRQLDAVVRPVLVGLWCALAAMALALYFVTGRAMTLAVSPNISKLAVALAGALLSIVSIGLGALAYGLARTDLPVAWIGDVATRGAWPREAWPASGAVVGATVACAVLGLLAAALNSRRPSVTSNFARENY